MALGAVNTFIPGAGGGVNYENSNTGLNYPGSTYATTFEHSNTNFLRQAIEYMIFDQAPKRFDPLKILNMTPMVDVPSD